MAATAIRDFIDEDNNADVPGALKLGEDYPFVLEQKTEQADNMGTGSGVFAVEHFGAPG